MSEVIALGIVLGVAEVVYFFAANRKKRPRALRPVMSDVLHGVPVFQGVAMSKSEAVVSEAAGVRMALATRCELAGPHTV